MKNRLLFLLLGFAASNLQAQWLYVDKGPWAYDPSSTHWMYVLPFYHFSLDYDGMGNGQSELIFDSTNTGFSDRWLYTGCFPYIYDCKTETWTKFRGLPLKWACELVPNDQGGYDSVWIYPFDTLGKYMVPEELTKDTSIFIHYIVQTSVTWRFYYTIHLRLVEQEGKNHFSASVTTNNRPAWAYEYNWNEETPAIYTKTSETEAELSLPNLGITIQLEFNEYKKGLYKVYGPDNQIIYQSYSGAEIFEFAWLYPQWWYN